MLDVGQHRGLQPLRMVQRLADAGLRLTEAAVRWVSWPRGACRRRVSALVGAVGAGIGKDVGGRTHAREHQPRNELGADVRLHAEASLRALAHLIRPGVSRAASIFRRSGGADECAIDHAALLQQQTLRGQMGVDGFEHGARQAVRFKRATELQQGGGIGGRLARQIDAD